MDKTLILYPATLMIALTLLLYVKNYLDNLKATKNRDINFSHFKTYSEKVPEYISVSRQTLKNQFELPIIFYFLISLILIFDVLNIGILSLIWIFVISRYIHSYVRLTSNYVPHRAKIFQVGLLSLMVCYIMFIYNAL